MKTLENTTDNLIKYYNLKMEERELYNDRRFMDAKWKREEIAAMLETDLMLWVQKQNETWGISIYDRETDESHYKDCSKQVRNISKVRISREWNIRNYSYTITITAEEKKAGEDTYTVRDIKSDIWSRNKSSLATTARKLARQAGLKFSGFDWE